MEAHRVRADHTNPQIRSIPLSDIGQRYEQLRIVNPKADGVVYRSMARHGQFLPVVAAAAPEGKVELLDGFKRLRAAKALGWASLRVRVMHLNARAGKAILLQLNWQIRTISAIEEALIVHSLHHEDGLSQVEIATLLGRHKSWVCRRVALLERLCDEVLERIRLGLVPVSICRELVRLPRGNQERVLDVICRHRLTCRETRRLVDVLTARPESEHPAILARPRHLAPTDRQRPLATGCSPLVTRLAQALQNLEGHCRIVGAIAARLELTDLTEQDRRFLIERGPPLLACLDHTITQLRTIMEAQP